MNNIDIKNNFIDDPFYRCLQCSKCQGCICERVYIINIALGYLDNYLCLKCISENQSVKDSEIFENLCEYINSRPCFKADWQKIDPKGCPKYPRCYCGEITVEGVK
ncbi:MAG: hypothetical protein AB1782_17385 [Cyanobacteriota bacterium]